MLAIGLALAAALSWGVADFGGGTLSRRAAALTVALVSQGAGFAALLLVWAAAGRGLDAKALWLGAVGGVGGALGIAGLYEALALGTMSVVSPLVACGAVVPFGISLATGERPSPAAIAGACAALAGAVLSSLQERRADEPGRRRAIPIALGASVALGLFIYLIGLAGHRDALGALVGARLTSLPVLVVVVLLRRAPLGLDRRLLLPVAAVGLADVLANGLFTLASGRGLLAIVSILASLFPVFTVLLAHLVLGERITPVQRAGVVLALAGVAAVSAL